MAKDTVICTIIVRCIVSKTGASLENGARGGGRRKGGYPLRTPLSYRGCEKHLARMENAAWLPSRTAAHHMNGAPKETLIKKGRKVIRQSHGKFWIAMHIATTKRDTDPEARAEITRLSIFHSFLVKEKTRKAALV